MLGSSGPRAIASATALAPLPHPSPRHRAALLGTGVFGRKAVEMDPTKEELEGILRKEHSTRISNVYDKETETQ